MDIETHEIWITPESVYTLIADIPLLTHFISPFVSYNEITHLPSPCRAMGVVIWQYDGLGPNRKPSIGMTWGSSAQDPSLTASCFYYDFSSASCSSAMAVSCTHHTRNNLGRINSYCNE